MSSSFCKLLDPVRKLLTYLVAVDVVGGVLTGAQVGAVVGMTGGLSVLFSVTHFMLAF